MFYQEYFMSNRDLLHNQSLRKFIPPPSGSPFGDFPASYAIRRNGAGARKKVGVICGNGPILETAFFFFYDHTIIPFNYFHTMVVRVFQLFPLSSTFFNLKRAHVIASII